MKPSAQVPHDELASLVQVMSPAQSSTGEHAAHAFPTG